MTDDFPLKNETHQILGACFEVYNTMGSGFLESVYQECLEVGLLVNFGTYPQLEYERIVNQKNQTGSTI